MQPTNNKSNLRKLLKTIDTFGNSLSFNINGKSKIKSLTGGFLSLTVNILLVAILIYNIFEFRNNNNPTSNITKNYRNTSVIEKIPNNLFNITSFLLASMGKITPLELHEKTTEFNLFTINTKASADSTDNLKHTKIGNFESCANVTKDYINSTYIKPLFNFFNKEYTYCSNFDETAETYLGGDPLKGQVKFIQGDLRLDLCGLFGDNCTNPDYLNTISQYFATKMGFYFMNNYIDILADNGHSSFVDTTLYDIDLSQDYVIKMFATKNIMLTDINPIYDFYPPKVDTFYSFSTTLLTKKRSVTDTDFNIQVSIYLDNYEYNITRRYIKFDAVLANILSMFQVLSLVAGYIHNFLTNGKVELSIMKKIYHFPVDIPIDKKPPSTVIELNNIFLEKLEGDNRNNDCNNINGHGQTSERSLEVIDRFRNKFKQIKPKENKFVVFCSMFRCLHRSRNTNILLKGIALVESELDIILILKKMIEYEEIKKVLFSEHQGNMLPLLNGREIHEKMDEVGFKESLRGQMNMKIENEAVGYYIMNYEHLSSSSDPVDKRIFEKLYRRVGGLTC
jgi:hypothetical protein